jgi:hypothetical protein
MTNNTHLISSGQIPNFLPRWRNIYRYSNQGCEYEIKQMRYVYHHMSQMGVNLGLGSDIQNPDHWPVVSEASLVDDQ